MSYERNGSVLLRYKWIILIIELVSSFHKYFLIPQYWESKAQALWQDNWCDGCSSSEKWNLSTLDGKKCCIIRMDSNNNSSLRKEETKLDCNNVIYISVQDKGSRYLV